MKRKTLSQSATLIALSFLSYQCVAEIDNIYVDVSDYKGGVFASKDMSVLATIKIADEDKDLPLSDENGDTNELIILPSYSSNIDNLLENVPTEIKEKEPWPENIILEMVNAKLPAVMAMLGSPSKGAKYLIRKNRLTDDQRLMLDESDLGDILQRYIVLRYDSIEDAKRAEVKVKKLPWIEFTGINKELNYSFVPNDQYIPINPQPSYYQWGIHSMNFPAAWDKTKGHGYIGIIDSIASMSHADISAVRPQLSLSISSPGNDYRYHGEHVTGIIAGSQNNNIGVSGGCASCSVALAQAAPLNSGVSESLYELVNRGVQVINMSFGRDNVSCSTYQPICDALAYAAQRDVVTVAAAGNFKNSAPDFPASQPTVLSVGGAQITNGYTPGVWTIWNYDSNSGSNWSGVQGVVAPAKSIVSTVTPGSSYYNGPEARCSDTIGYDPFGYYGQDESGILNDGYGSCTGTSMATPYVSALAGIIRSINPRSSYQNINNYIRMSGDKSGAPTGQYGYGLPRANIAVDSTINTNPKRLTPLFSYFSSGRKDYFYTTVPQLAAAAYSGTLYPVNTPNVTSSRYVSIGTTISGYLSFPGSSYLNKPRAQVWIFTTPVNPYSANTHLVPLYRMSWKCGDGGWVDICNTNPNHTDFTYTTEASGIYAFQAVGYKLDGIEGYIYPKSVGQPPNTVRLMRKYNPTFDDHAIFPEPEIFIMQAQGYTEDSGSDWLGYVYPNTNGNMPNY